MRLEELIQEADGDVNLKIRKMLKTVESPLPILLLGVDVFVPFTVQEISMLLTLYVIGRQPIV